MFLYVLLCARTPFDSHKYSATSVYEKLQNTEVDVASGVWSSISESAKELVLGMLEKDVDQRLSCDEILSEWVLICFEFCKISFVNWNSEVLCAIGFNR